ncbi:MAG: hypothetical protein MJ240_07390 [Kiritimatiellae bacterium]|nr:hypothetical protein [Kiritimatiellia bacterium]
MSLLIGMLAATLAAAPTVDAVESGLAARDAELDAEWLAVGGRAELETRCADFRKGLRKATGYGAIARTPLNAQILGTKDYGAFRIEKVLMESAPGAYVTALVFLPAAEIPPPYAGFMFIPGHSNNGKAADDYLHTCELGARNGLASIIYDPLGQGERSQGAGLISADEHVRIGAYASLMGETTATYMMRDAVRVFDYLAGRPDMDATRLGVCGNSGGGTMSAFFMVADDRVKAATPSCYLSSLREHVLACGPQDAEQNFFGAQEWGFNHAAMILSAGCPVLINAAVEDFFQIAGSRATYQVVRNVAAKFSLPADWYALSEAPGRHKMSQVHRERAVAFLLKHLSGKAHTVRETETTAFTAADWQVTPMGAVAKLPGFKSVYDTLSDKMAQQGVSVERAAACARERVLRELAGGDCRGVVGTLRGNVVQGRQVRLHVGGTVGVDEATVTLFADGARLVQRPVRKGKRSYYERRKDDEVVAVDLYLAGRSLVALRAAELLTVAAEVTRRTGQKPVLVAEGRYTVPAKFAEAADPAAFAAVTHVAEPKPWQEAIRTRDYLSFADVDRVEAEEAACK